VAPEDVAQQIGTEVIVQEEARTLHLPGRCCCASDNDSSLYRAFHDAVVVPLALARRGKSF
jgi:hypothetical protein